MSKPEENKASALNTKPETSDSLRKQKEYWRQQVRENPKGSGWNLAGTIPDRYRP